MAFLEGKLHSPDLNRLTAMYMESMRQNAEAQRQQMAMELAARQRAEDIARQADVGYQAQVGRAAGEREAGQRYGSATNFDPTTARLMYTGSTNPADAMRVLHGVSGYTGVDPNLIYKTMSQTANQQYTSPGVEGQTVHEIERQQRKAIAEEPTRRSDYVQGQMATQPQKELIGTQAEAKQGLVETQQDFNRQMTEMKREWQKEDIAESSRLKEREIEVKAAIARGQIDFRTGLELMKQAEQRERTAKQNILRMKAQLDLSDADSENNKFWVFEMAREQGVNPKQAWEAFLEQYD